MVSAMSMYLDIFSFYTSKYTLQYYSSTNVVVLNEFKSNLQGIQRLNKVQKLSKKTSFFLAKVNTYISIFLVRGGHFRNVYVDKGWVLTQMSTSVYKG